MIQHGLHPIENGQYILPTKEVMRLMNTLKQIVINRLPGMIVHGRPRLGKSWAVKFASKHLPDEVGAPVPIFLSSCKQYRVPNEEKFYLDLLNDFKFPFPAKRKPADMRRQIVNLMLEKGERSVLRRVVLVIDEAQRLAEWQFNCLIDIYNELDRENIGMSVVSVGQEELLSRRSFFLEQKKAQIIGRFMTHEHHFHGIQTKEDIALCLHCYDEISEFPDNSGWSYTRYFFPEAYQEGSRLEHFTQDLYNLFIEIRREYGLAKDFEIPMEYFAYTVENALKIYGANGKQSKWLTLNQLKEAIKISGYIESEIYMALA